MLIWIPDFNKEFKFSFSLVDRDEDIVDLTGGLEDGEEGISSVGRFQPCYKNTANRKSFDNQMNLADIDAKEDFGDVTSERNGPGRYWPCYVHFHNRYKRRLLYSELMSIDNQN